MSPPAKDADKARPPARPGRPTSYQTGVSAEDRAAAYFTGHGFTILARRFRSPGGEIDIVARRDNLLVFAEVKARPRLDDAAWSITPRGQRRIAAAAQAWLAAHPPDGVDDMRFDAVLIAPGRDPLHLPGAFEIEPES